MRANLAVNTKNGTEWSSVAIGSALLGTKLGKSNSTGL